MRSALRFIAAGVIVAGAGFACSNDSMTDFNAPFALGLTLTPSLDTIFVTNTVATAPPLVLTLTATSMTLPVQTPQGVEWTSSNPAVAVVTDGLVHAAGTGTTIVTARVNNDRAKATVVVALRTTQGPATIVTRSAPEKALTR
jgi:uncharacterized protein YjdB